MKKMLIHVYFFWLATERESELAIEVPASLQASSNVTIDLPLSYLYGLLNRSFWLFTKSPRESSSPIASARAAELKTACCCCCPKWAYIMIQGVKRHHQWTRTKFVVIDVSRFSPEMKKKVFSSWLDWVYLSVYSSGRWRGAGRGGGSGLWNGEITKRTALGNKP